MLSVCVDRHIHLNEASKTTTTTTLRGHFGLSRGHSWTSLSQWLPSLQHRLRQLPLVDGHPLRVGVGLPVPTSDDVAASLGTRLRKWFRSLRWSGTISCLAATMPLLLVWARWNESWSRSWVRQCPRSGNLSWTVSSSHHRSACKIVFGSLSWIYQCLRSRRLCQCPRPWKNLKISFSLFLRSVSKSEFWIRSHWCFGSWRNFGLLCSPCLRSVFKNVLCTGAPDHGDNWSCCPAGACGAYARTNCGADFCGAPDHGNWAK